MIAASSPTPAGSRVSSARLYRFSDPSVPDPQGDWSHHVAGFDLFGALGAFGPWTAPIGVEKIAAAPTQLKVRGFDNRTTAGGGPDPPPPGDPQAWTGGTLTATVNWSGAAFTMYPDLRTARVTVEAVDIKSGAVTETLAQSDLVLPPRQVDLLTVSSVTVTQASDTNWQVDIQTTPPLSVLSDSDPSLLLILSTQDGNRERYVTRPIVPSSGATAVARFTAGASARIVATPNDFVGQPAYLVSGYGANLVMSIPLSVALGAKTARAQISVIGSTEDPFLQNEQIIDPNGVNPPRTQPQSVVVMFTGAQRLVPPTPPTPVHEVHHVYYDPADFNGRASKTLPFDTSATAGVDGFVLQRAPVQSLMLADMKRRIALANAADPNPVVIDGGGPRPDLQAWIGALPSWLAAYNAGTRLRPPSTFTMADVLSDSSARQSFMDHFYGGLLDDELRALADMPNNAIGFARVNSTPAKPGSPIRDSVDGTGYGRTVYRLAAVNLPGSASGLTASIGPYYTRVVAAPRAPVLYKVQPTASSAVIAWALDENPDVAGYLVYRAASVQDLADLRWFGSNPAYPQTSGLASITIDPTKAQTLSFGAGAIDPRIIALVPDPRLCARDYDNSDIGEVPLPVGPAPDAINAIYRLSDYNSTRTPLDQPQAFNYWMPPATGGIAQLVTDSPTQSRVTGLRIGLGRRTPVVAIATFAGTVRVFGAVAVPTRSFPGWSVRIATARSKCTARLFAAQHERNYAYAVVVGRYLRQSFAAVEGVCCHAARPGRVIE